MPNNTTKQICQICHTEVNNLGYHVFNKHQISSKEYYDNYLKIQNEEICITCNTQRTKYYNLKRGYGLYCSVKCSNNNDELTIQRTLKRKQTYEDNPDIILGASKKLKDTYKNNPSLSIENTKKRLKTLEDNPDIMVDVIKQREETYRNNPDILHQMRNNQSIAKRNAWNRLKKDGKNISCYLYLIRHQTKPIIKIGITEFPDQRLYRIRKHFGKCDIIHLKKDSYDVIKQLEEYLHEYFNEYCKVQPKGDGRTEWFDESILTETLSLLG